jgi:hypothetical protein
MAREVTIVSGGATISASTRILTHIGITAIDLWEDKDANGRPDRFLRRLKNWSERENEIVDLGTPAELTGKVIQWLWMPSQPPDSQDGWSVELDLRQGGHNLERFPLPMSGVYPVGQKFGLFETWAKLVSA